MGPLAAALIVLSAALGAATGTAAGDTAGNTPAVLDGEGPTMNAASLNRTRIFDHVSTEISAPGPWTVRTRAANSSGAGWTDLVADTFALSGRHNVYELHFRAGGLGPAGGEIPPDAKWRVTAEAGTDRREGFLVAGGIGGEAAHSPFQMDARSFRGPLYELGFPEGSGFYGSLRTPGTSQNVIDALRLRFDAKLFGLLKVHRDESDFRWEVKSIETGSQSAVRRSEASVRALVRYVDPQPQNLVVCGNLILQKVDLAIPELVMHLGSDVTLRNSFEVPAGTEILLPGASALEPLSRTRPDVPYDWIVLANPAGAVLHWLDLPGRAANLHPLLYVDTPEKKNGDGRTVAGYRVEKIDKNWSAAAGNDHAVTLLQNVAVLGGPEWYAALRNPGFAAAAAKGLDEPPSRWTVRLEKLP